ncbi:hypothetical protein LNP74_28210 [Klebsiella pneumoniae subsp. pneumoniae]|nr:hypothetical protein [Klebsiella pneumoniae subsp. pneumoniae]
MLLIEHDMGMVMEDFGSYHRPRSRGRHRPRRAAGAIQANASVIAA